MTASILRQRSGFCWRLLITIACLGMFDFAGVADLNSITNSLQFFLNNDNVVKATLNSTGLGLGVIPSTNLEVSGNAIVSDHLSVGSTSANSSSNLFVQGTLGLNCQTITGSSNVNIGDYSYVFVNASSNITLTLPYSANVLGRVITIKSLNSTSEPILTGLACTIENAVTLKLKTNASGAWPSVTLHATNSGWNLIQLLGKASYGPFLDHNIALWYNSSDLDGDGDEEGLGEANVDASGNVSIWKDLSGNQKHTQGNASRLPSYAAYSGMNNKYAVYFNGAKQNYLDVSNVYIDSQNTTFTVVNILNNGRSFIWSLKSDDFYLGTKDNGLCFTHDHEDVPYSKFGSPDIITTRSNGAASSYQIYYSGNVRLDSSVTTNIIDGRTAGAQSFVIGARTSSTSSTYSTTAYIAEIIMYNSTLSDTERRQVESYLARKYTLSVNAN